VNLGLTQREAGRFDEAVTSLQSAIEIEPHSAEAYANLALVRVDQGLIPQAIGCAQQAVSLRADFAPAHNALGLALDAQGDHEQAMTSFREAVRLNPKFAEAYNNLGSALKSLNRNGEAVVCFEQALKLDASSPQAHNGLGTVLQLTDQAADALAEYEQALDLKPDYAEAHSNIGQLMGEVGNYTAAMARYEEAMRLQPALASVRNNRAITLLLLGRLAEGWPEYEWRWKVAGAPRFPWNRPTWDGSPLAGRTILLFFEQGIGDALQFIRYAPLVKDRGGNVLVACPRKLVPILSTCAGIDGFVVDGEPAVHFDVQAGLLSLPGIFGTELDTIPADVPYLSAPADLVERWRERLAGERRLRVGIHWQGNPNYRGDRRRSMPLECFAPLAAVPGVKLYSLQKGFGSEQLADAGFAVEDLGSTLDQPDAAFYETAAVIKNLDLVISSDTALVHLAGALAAPTWVALPFSPDWRWLLDRTDSPWYPTLRLFRQPAVGAWSDVFAQIARELTQLVAERGR
jgi:tetratricopeptide (TPR) repeat protein